MPRHGVSSWTDQHQRFPSLVSTSWVTNLAVASIVMLATTLIGIQPSGAENPLELSDELSLDGVYVSPQRNELDEQAMQRAVERARAVGIRLVAVAPNNPEPDAASFARRILEAVNADAVVVYPPEGGIEAYVIGEFDSAKFRALAEARSKANPEAALDAFTEELLEEPTTGIPDLVRTLVVVMLVLAVVLALIVLVENQLLSRRAKARRASLLR